MSCAAPECDRTAMSQGLCWTHLKRLQRGGSLAGEIRTRHGTGKEMLLEAVFAYLEIKPTDDEGWRKAWHRLRVAARRYALREKPTDPRGRKRGE